MTASGYVFDAYGTLFDVHSAVRQHAETLGEKGPMLSEIWRSKQLEYSWVRSLMGSWTDFWQLTQDALDYAMKATAVSDPALREKLLESYWTLTCHDDVRPALAKLRASGARIGILSNGSRAMLDAAIASAAIADLIDDVFSVDAIKTFKTSPEVYQMVTDAWSCPAGQISLQSSNRWDIAGANRFGMQTIWINRVGFPDEYPNHPPDRVIASLSDI